MKLEIKKDAIVTESFKEDFYNLLYNFFEKYFIECGSEYFTKTANWQKEYGSFREYLKVFTGEQQIIEADKTTSPLSDALSADLVKRGMKFVGSTIIYSYLQAIGVIFSHDEECFMYKGNRL